jgi:hypothetical protein
MRKKISAILTTTLFLTQTLCAKDPELSYKRKFGEVTWEGMKFHRYCLRAENFPHQQGFKLVVKSFDGTQNETFRYVANRRGHLILQRPEDLQGEEDIYAICPVRKGERLKLAMQAEEGEAFYEVDFIPFPLEMKSKKGIRLHLELKGVLGEKFLLLAQGFKPHEPIRLQLQVDKDQIDLDAKVTSLGDLCTMIERPQGVTGEEVKLFLKRKNEEIVFPFAWGAPALQLVGACCLEIK